VTRSRSTFVLALLWMMVRCALAQQPPRLDPAAWGGDHAGQAVAEFTSGDECLFCHRDVGPTWGTNRHGQTVRAANPDDAGLAALGKSPEFKSLADQVELLLGGRNQQRFLKRGEEHGRLDLLSTTWVPAMRDRQPILITRGSQRWDSRTFARGCAGCHATGVDSRKQTFSASSLDCFVCHGEPPAKHTTQGSLVFLSPHRSDSPRVVTSICAQCHLRTGTSQSSGLPYPNNFLAGDNLFRDFRVDLSDVAIQKLNPGDRHVQENVRDVVLLGRETVTCLSCHDIHKQSSQKHHVVASGDSCLNCHSAKSRKDRVPYEVHSVTCGY
jgi:hypothetical protein